MLDPRDEDALDHHRTAGRALIAYSMVGLTLGSVMTSLGYVGTGFLDGPAAFGIGLATLFVGISLRYPRPSKAA